MFNPNEPIAEQLVINAEDLRPRVMTPTVTQPNPTTNLGGAMSTEFPSFGSDLSSGVQSFLTRMGSGTRADDYEDMRKASLQAAQLGIEGGIIHASGLAGGMLGQGLGKALGFNTPRETKKARIDEMMAQYPDPQTYEDYMAIAAGAKEIGELDLWEKAFNMAQDMLSKNKDKKWQSDLINKKASIARYALSKGYTLSDAQVSDIASFTANKSSLHGTLAVNVHPWKDIVDRALEGMTPNKEEVDPSESTEIESATETDLTGTLKDMSDEKRFQAFDQKFTVAVKPYAEQLDTISGGLEIVKLVRGGQTRDQILSSPNAAAMPQLERMLAKFNSDNRISVPEVKQVMKIGGLGTRIVNSIERFLGGDISAGTLNDIDAMLIALGKLNQQKYNTKVSEVRLKAGKLPQADVERWFPFKGQFTTLTDKQKLDLVNKKIKEKLEAGEK